MWQQRTAISGVSLATIELGSNRHQIIHRDEAFTGRSGLDTPGPTGQQRNARAAFRIIAFASRQAAIAIEGIAMRGDADRRIVRIGGRPVSVMRDWVRPDVS